MASGETNRIFLSALALGGLTLVPLIAELVRERIIKRRRNAGTNPKSNA